MVTSKNKIGSLFLDNNWQQFRVPYYDEAHDVVYYCLWTDIKSLDPNKNWKILFNENRQKVYDFFKGSGYLKKEVQLSSEEISIKLPVYENDKVCDIDIETTKIEDGKFALSLFLDDKKSLDPRPNGVVKLLYKLEQSSEYVDINKIKKDSKSYFKQLGEEKGSLETLSEYFDDGKSGDFKIKDITDLKKLLDIKDVKDLNDFLEASVTASNKLAAQIRSELNSVNNYANLTTDPPKDIISKSDLEKVQRYVIEDSKYLADFSYKVFPDIIDNVESGMGSFTGDAKQSYSQSIKDLETELEKIYALANKWGIMPLVECGIALAAVKLETQGYLALSRKILEELSRLTKNYKSLSGTFAQYKNIAEQIKKVALKTTSPQDFEWVEEIKKQAEKILSEIGKQFIKTLTQQCLLLLSSENPKNDFNYGFLSPDDVFGSSEELDKAISGLTNNPDLINKENIKSSLLTYVKSVFTQLTGKEVCRLLQGAAENELILILQQIAVETEADKFFTSPVEHRSFWKKIGTKFGTAFCKKINDADDQTLQYVDYCGTQIPTTIADNLPPSYGEAPDTPSILDISDFEDLLNGDFLDSILPPINLGALLDRAYKEAQDSLNKYEKYFEDDKKNIRSLAESNKELLSSDENDLKKELGKKTKEDSSSISINNLLYGNNNNKQLIPPSSILQKYGGIETNSDWKDNNYGGALADGTVFDLIKGDPFKSVQIYNSKYQINYDSSKFLNWNSIGGILSTTGQLQTGKNPAIILGEQIEGQENTKPIDRTYPDPISAGNKTITVIQVYRNIFNEVLDSFLDFYNSQVAELDVLQIVEFYKKERREEIKKFLCDASEDENQTLLYSAEAKLAGDLEALRIYIFTRIIERYPNLLSALVLLPEEQSKLLKKTAPVIIPDIADVFQKEVENFLVEIPVKQVLCKTGFTIEDLIKAEIDLLIKVENKKIKTKSISTIISEIAELKYELVEQVENNVVIEFGENKFEIPQKDLKEKLGEIIQNYKKDFNNKTEQEIVNILNNNLRITKYKLIATTSLTWSGIAIFEETKETKITIPPYIFADANIKLYSSIFYEKNVEQSWENLFSKLKDQFAKILEDDKIIDLGSNLFPVGLFNDIISALVIQKSLIPVEKDYFKSLKPAILQRFTGGLIPLGKDLTAAQLAYDDYQKITNFSLKNKSFSLWLLILMMIPKLVIAAVKSILMSALYFSAPIVYHALMLAQSLGLSFPDEFFDWLNKKTQEEILKGLDPDSPEAKKIKKKISEIPSQKQALLDLKCDI